MIIPANISAAHVEEFCSSLAKGEHPIDVCCQPVAGQPERECFSVVEQQVSEFGGQLVLGWAIWERTGVFIEAEFHAVWRNPDAKLIDVVPRFATFGSITFLPDANSKYNGQQVDNVRKSMVKDMDVVRFLFLAKRRFEIFNTGDLANQHGEIALPKRLYREYEKLMKEWARLERRIEARYP
ncbi:hypothetical protein [Polaromonas naphthalenivorans]|uniref:Uncharacterized protein n=1 Tax=Polaromonas naphthalenivorans (strain CJ2) TaxID=365044 RepID=A1VPJ7_POLNA|nr:hypothetical protein [Polaromonas naphthalenivorans]ABM37575.1 hypothetical protein Pnap_2267 [Polaromonas naphthalenivorans CJ2]